MSKKSNFFERVRELLHLELNYTPREVTFGTHIFLIREVRYADVKKLIAIEREVYDGDVPWGRSAFLEEMNGNKPVIYLLAEDQGTVVGFIGVRFDGSDGHITNVAVKKKYQKLGLGRFFLEEVEAVARQNEFKSLSLEVRISNLDAQRLYRKFGFVSQRVKANYYRSNNEDALDMLYEFEGE